MIAFAPRRPSPTPVFDTYWRFATERQRIFHLKAAGQGPPWTSDAILTAHRFTNAYRAADRVSQFLINRVIPGSLRDPIDAVFRTLLFKVFNRVSTWQCLEQEIGELHVSTFDAERLTDVLSGARALGQQIYSAAYIMPMPHEPAARTKHEAHLLLLARLLTNGTLERLCESPTLQQSYELLLAVPSFGPFLAFQYAIDINYAPVVDHSEMEFVVAGPGARSGINKCFADVDGLTYEDVIRYTCDRADIEFSSRDLQFSDLWGRPLQLIDCQNLFCEVDKYARVAHPEFTPAGHRTRIKQRYSPDPKGMSFGFPPKWGLSIPESAKCDAALSLRGLLAASTQ